MTFIFGIGVTMKNRKNVLFTGLTVLVIISCLFATAPLTGFTAENNKFTDADAQILKTGDHDAVADVVYKLADMYDSQGKEALNSAVPALIESAYRELSMPENERWNIFEIIRVLSVTGDKRAKPLLLYIMATLSGGGNPFTAQGFLAIGQSTIKDVMDSLKSTSSDTRGRATVTLHKMNEYDESGTFFSPKDREMIKDRLVANLVDEEASIRIYSVVALRSFGDETVIKPLEHIEKHDAHKDSGGTYEVRLEATETLNYIRSKLK